MGSDSTTRLMGKVSCRTKMPMTSVTSNLIAESLNIPAHIGLMASSEHSGSNTLH